MQLVIYQDNNKKWRWKIADLTAIADWAYSARGFASELDAKQNYEAVAAWIKSQP